jgi:hypothetical protein
MVRLLSLGINVDEPILKPPVAVDWERSLPRIAAMGLKLPDSAVPATDAGTNPVGQGIGSEAIVGGCPRPVTCGSSRGELRQVDRCGAGPDRVALSSASRLAD